MVFRVKELLKINKKNRLPSDEDRWRRPSWWWTSSSSCSTPELSPTRLRMENTDLAGRLCRRRPEPAEPSSPAPPAADAESPWRAECVLRSMTTAAPVLTTPQWLRDSETIIAAVRASIGKPSECFSGLSGNVRLCFERVRLWV